MSESDFPSSLEIKALAEDYGYKERRLEVSSTLFFQEMNPENSKYPININVFYTTRGVMTQLPHPTQGYNSLWRSTAYDSLESLAMLFENPRSHTGRGYRQAKNAVRGCANCGEQKVRTEYSSNQWRAGPGKAVCSECITGNKTGNNGGNSNGKKNNKENDSNVNNESFPRLSEDTLKQHNKQSNSNKKNQIKVKNEMERRQFNCPLCPEEGRGKHVFFKKVPVMKPIVKCSKCKKVKQGDCERLYPIPRGEEKGYGHYRCGECKNTWGSSRAIGNIGQQCHTCEIAGTTDKWVRPFRIEVYKSGKSGGISGGGARPAGRSMRRKPRETIPEEEEAEDTYSPTDQRRFNNRGGNALAGGGGGGAGRSFDWVDVKKEVEAVEQETAPAASRLSHYKTLQHKCEGCATGMCRSRKLPISGVHDVHDGDTVSTSGSIMTNSEIDKSEFIDRDIDFDDWDEDDGVEVWVSIGANGKMLRG